MLAAKELGIKTQTNVSQQYNESDCDDIHELALTVGLNLTSIRDCSALKNTYFPILIQSVEGEFFLFNKTKLYDPRYNTYRSCKKLDFQMKATWQCNPIGIPLIYNYLSLSKLLLRNFKSEMVFFGWMGILTAITTLLFSFGAGFIFSHLYDLSVAQYNTIFIIFLFFSIGTTLFAALSEVFLKKLDLKLLCYIVPSVWHHLFYLPLTTINRLKLGHLAQQFINYESAVAVLASLNFTIIFRMISLLGIFLYMLYYQTDLAWSYLGISVLWLSIKLILLPRKMQHDHRVLVKQGDITQFLSEALFQMTKIRSSRAEEMVFKRWLHHAIQSKMHASAGFKIGLLLSVLDASISPLLLLLLYLGTYLGYEKINIHLFLPFMICAGQFSSLLDKLSLDVTDLLRVLPNINQLKSVMLEPIEQVDNTSISHDMTGEIRFDHVSLQHAEANCCILEDVSFHIPAGKCVAIVGKSGAGKSSLLRLLLKLESVSSGSIFLDAVDINHIHTGTLRGQIGVVLQTTQVFPGTVFSNIAANIDLSHEEAWALAKSVGLDEDISNMPMKMHTYISDNAGECLSGGQKQKILIARALATKPKILLLDEATSSLDNASQALIFENLKDLNMTRIIIAHRYSTILYADKVYVLDQGKLINNL
jgi:ABC-type bacteriocin/lantibiotic exporter with double-glycine peptidase domain